MIPQDDNDQSLENPKQLALWQDTAEIMLNDGARGVVINGEPYVSILDAYKIYGKSKNPNRDWKRDRRELLDQSYDLSQLVQHQFLDKSGKLNKATPVVNTEQLMRIAQVAKFPEWEPLRAEMARLMADKARGNPTKPQIPIRQSKKFRQHLDANYTPELAEQAIEIRDNTKDSLREISSEWAQRGAKGADYGRLNNDVTEAATGQPVKYWRDRMGITGSPREYFSAEKNAAIDWVQRMAKTLHKRRDSDGVHELEKDIFDAGGVIDHEKLRRLVPDLDLDTPSVPPEQKALSAGGE